MEQGTSPSTNSTSVSASEIAAALDGLAGLAAVICDDFTIVAANQAYRQHFGDGSPVCGRLCFEISHRYASPCAEMGELCPLERARSTGGNARTFHVHLTAAGAEHEEVTIQPLSTAGRRTRYYVERLLPTKIASARPAQGVLVGASAAFSSMVELISRAGPSGAGVLLLGESGTGKEMAARAVHALSPRASGPFVPLECSGLNESLFESELFGHEKGAFTGAVERKRGLVEVAHGGTLFLDEAGDIPMAQQVKLLRLLETGAFRRVGGVESRHSDFRLVCATYRDLAAQSEAGEFRQDLYYRISTFPIRLPPLRERVADIPLLVESFLQRSESRHIRDIEPAAVELLQRHSFPGNVRELHNLLERACLLVDGDTLGPEHLPAELREGWHRSDPRSQWDKVIPLHEVEKSYLAWASSYFEGDRSELARRLGLSERTLYRKLRHLDPLRQPLKAPPRKVSPATTAVDRVSVAPRVGAGRQRPAAKAPGPAPGGRPQ